MLLTQLKLKIIFFILKTEEIGQLILNFSYIKELTEPFLL